ncbi:MAG: hypothetical protein PHH69_00005, partial [Candidatus Omnitrophica bacterium]|nr:hypothetical protein [Candidatus Omnitrophota bacterium]
LETSRGKLMQLVLVGQPELSEKLKQFNLRQIRQRICVKYNISPLQENEIKDYIEFRLQKVGANNIVISPQCYKIIFEFSKGIPRLINVLCDRALLYGFAREKRTFDEETFRNCAEEIG